MEFYGEKQKDIGKNMKDLEGVLQGKANNLRMVEEGKTLHSHCISYRQKLTSRGSATAESPTAKQ